MTRRLPPEAMAKRDTKLVAAWNRGDRDVVEIAALYGHSPELVRNALARANHAGRLMRPLRRNGSLAFEVPQPSAEERAALLRGEVLRAGNYNLALTTPVGPFAVTVDGVPLVSQLGADDAVRAVWLLRAALVIGWKGKPKLDAEPGEPCPGAGQRPVGSGEVSDGR